jgi:hypothetical protein
MKNQISKARFAALAVGIAIVMSSCGIQNQAGDSSGASGKTKNFAILADGQWCYDTPEEQMAANRVFEDVHMNWHRNPYDVNNDGEIGPGDHQSIMENIFTNWEAQIGGCPAPAPAAASASEEIAAEAAVYSCVKPEKKQEMIDGYKEQIAKTDYPADWSAAAIADYQDQMKRGLATAELICTN